MLRRQQPAFPRPDKSISRVNLRQANLGPLAHTQRRAHNLPPLAHTQSPTTCVLSPTLSCAEAVRPCETSGQRLTWRQTCRPCVTCRQCLTCREGTGRARGPAVKMQARCKHDARRNHESHHAPVYTHSVCAIDSSHTHGLFIAYTHISR